MAPVAAQTASQPTIAPPLSPDLVTYGLTTSRSITIYGSGFVAGATITVGSLSGATVAGDAADEVTRYVFISATKLQFYWPNTSLPSGAYAVTVTNPAGAGGLSTTVADGFTVAAAQPTFTTTTPLSPNPVTYATTLSRSIAIYGSGFIEGATIAVGGLSGTTVADSDATETRPFVYVSSSQLRFYWRNTSLAPGSYTVQVTNPAAAGGLSATLTDGFTVAKPQPAFAATAPISPTPVLYGIDRSRAINIYGSEFVEGATITVGSLSGTTVAGDVADETLRYVFVSKSKLQFYWPNTSLQPGSYDVRVTNPAAAGGLSATLTGGFVVTSSQPTISSVSHPAVTYAVSNDASVAIYGANFLLGATITVGSLSGQTVAESTATAAIPFVYVSSSQLKFYWSNTSLAPGSYTVQVTNPATGGGLSASLTGGFTVTKPQPAFAATTPVSPTPVIYGMDSSKAISLYGSEFVVGATITVGSLSGTTVAGDVADETLRYVFVSKSKLQFYWPNTSLAAGSYAVTVTNPAVAGGLSATLAAGFIVSSAQPSITSTYPSPVTYGVTADSAVTIYGASFQVGATVAFSGPSPSTTIRLSGITQLSSDSAATATTPFVHVTAGRLSAYWANTSLPPGRYTVTVTNPPDAGGATGTLVDGFEVLAANPVVSSASPSPVIYDQQVSRAITVYGSNFVSGATLTIGTPNGGVCQPKTCLAGVTVAGDIADTALPFVFVRSSRLSFYWEHVTLTPGAYDITVRNPEAAGGLSTTLPGGFVVDGPRPIVSAVTPSTVEYGLTPAGKVVIAGSWFYAPDGADRPRVEIGNFSCLAVTGEGATASAPCIYVSNRRIEIYREPASITPGAHAVRVTNPQYAGAVTGELPGGLTVTAPLPRIETIKPAAVTAGITSSRAIDIVGTYDPGAHLEFIAGATVTVANTNPAAATGNLLCENVVGGTTPNPTTPCVLVGGGLIRFYWDSAQAAASTRLGPGTYDVTVTNPASRGGLTDTKSAAFRVTLTPEILGIEPATGIGAGARGAVVTVTSSGFGAGTTMAVADASPDPTSGRPIVLKSPFRANAAEDGGSFVIDVAESTAPGMRIVTLTTADGVHAFTCPDPTGPAATCKNGLTITPAPVMTSITPALGAGASGRSLAITGDRFVPKTAPSGSETAILFPAGVTGTCTVTSATAITCSGVAVGPGVTPGQYAVVAVNPDGGRTSGLLTINAAPAFGSISPSQGAPGSTTSVTIAGTGFQIGLSVAMDAAIAVTVRSVSATAISADLTISATATAGYHPLTVANPDGGSVAVPQVFSVGPPPPDALSAIATYGKQNVSAVQYRPWSGAAWSGPYAGPVLGSPPVWQVMKANPIRDERILAVVDDQRRLTLHVWNGESWGGRLDAAASSGLARPSQTVDVAFEPTSGRGVVVYARTDSTTLRYRTWDGAGWSAESFVDDAVNGQLTTDRPLWVRLEARPATIDRPNDLVLVYGDAGDDVAAVVWNGSTWEQSVLLTTTAAGHEAPLFDVAFERLTGRAMAAWADASTPGNLRYRIWNAGWGAAATVSVGSTDGVTAVRLASDHGSNRIAAGSGTGVAGLAALVWSGSGWSAPFPLTSSLARAGDGRAFDLAWEGVSSELVSAYGTAAAPGGVFRVWSSGAWSGEAPIPAPAGGSTPAWIELANARGEDQLAFSSFDIAGRVTLARWNGTTSSDVIAAESAGSGVLSGVAGRAVAVSLAQHLAGPATVVTPPSATADTTAPVTTTGQPPPVITDLRLGASAPTPNAIPIRWTVPLDDSGAPAGYDVRYSTAASFDFDAAIPYTAHTPTTLGDTASLVIEGLVPGTTYQIGVKARDGVGQVGALSNVLAAPTAPPAADAIAPAPITDLAVFAGATTGPSLLLQWTATSDDGADPSSGPAGAYEVRYATEPLTAANFTQGTFVAAFPPGPRGSTQELIVSGLVSNTNYYMALIAVDDGGNRSALSNVAMGRTALRTGYTLVSVPRALSSATPDAVFGDDVGVPPYAYRWRSSGPTIDDGCYEGTVQTPSTPDFPTCATLLTSVATGAGYYLDSSGSLAVLDAPGAAVSAPTFEVPLTIGFNMVGNPYETDIPLAAVLVKRGGATLSYADAVVQGWVAPAMYLYDGATTQAYAPGEAGAVLKPWNGAWIESRVPDAVLEFVRP